MIEIDPIERTFELARAELAPSGSDRARSRAALGLGPKASAGTARTPSAVRSWKALRASGKVGLLVGMFLVGTSFGAGYWLGHREDARRAGAIASSQARQEPARPSLLTPADAANSPEMTPPLALLGEASRASEAIAVAANGPAAPARRRPPQPARATSVADDELSLLRRVERALRAEDPALALALIAELEERFPNTELAEERRAATVLAQCAAAGPGAQLRARSFLRDRPASVYAERIRAACGLDGAPGKPSVEGSAGAGHE